MVVTTPEQLASELAEHSDQLKREIRYITGHGVKLPVRILDVPDNGAVADAPLVVVFHGGIGEDTNYPFFYGHRFAAEKNSLPRTVLSICDPTLEISKKLRFGWYAGYEGVDVPRAIHSMLEAVIGKIKPSRTIFVGGSIGAHAALRHIGKFPGALYIGLNPLPNINKYWRSGVEAFYETCWPGQYDKEYMTSPHVINDSADAYAGKNLSNTFLIIQNASDHHMARQAVPMIEKLTLHPEMTTKVMAIMPFWPNDLGHSAPKGVFERWVEAAVISCNTEPTTVALTYNALQNKTPQNRSPNLSKLDHGHAKALVRKALSRVG